MEIRDELKHIVWSFKVADVEESFEELRIYFDGNEHVTVAEIEFLKEELANLPIDFMRDNIHYAAVISIKLAKFTKNIYHVNLYTNYPKAKYPQDIFYAWGGPKNEFTLVCDA